MWNISAFLHKQWLVTTQDRASGTMEFYIQKIIIFSQHIIVF